MAMPAWRSRLYFGFGREALGLGRIAAPPGTSLRFIYLLRPAGQSGVSAADDVSIFVMCDVSMKGAGTAKSREEARRTKYLLYGQRWNADSYGLTDKYRVGRSHACKMNCMQFQFGSSNEEASKQKGAGRAKPKIAIVSLLKSWRQEKNELSDWEGG